MSGISLLEYESKHGAVNVKTKPNVVAQNPFSRNKKYTSIKIPAISTIAGNDDAKSFIPKHLYDNAVA